MFSAADATPVRASAKGQGERLAVPLASDDEQAIETAAQLACNAVCEPLVVSISQPLGCPHEPGT